MSSSVIVSTLNVKDNNIVYLVNKFSIDFTNKSTIWLRTTFFLNKELKKNWILEFNTILIQWGWNMIILILFSLITDITTIIILEINYILNEIDSLTIDKYVFQN